MTTPVELIRQKVHELADQLPADANWDDVMYQVAMRRSIEQGLIDADQGLLIPVEELLQEFSTPR